MANRTHYPIQVAEKNEVKAVIAHFVGNAGSSPTSFDTKELASVTRTGVGTYDLVFNHAYPTGLVPQVDVRGATAGLKGRVTAWDPAAKTMSITTEVGAVATNAATTDRVGLVIWCRNTGVNT